MPAKRELTDTKMHEIYQRILNGETQTALALEYDVTQSALSKRLKHYSPPTKKLEIATSISPSKPNRPTKMSLDDLRYYVGKFSGKSFRGTIPEARDALITILQKIDDNGMINW